ncbi:hypothetical protein [Geodermatophilus sp. CPCC 205506]|uniref:hypothetical protein n=1 Tax=Geodermatophilus sp. CPCC 205506 TaxID=2936596 RepID=UPI003EE96D1A
MHTRTLAAAATLALGATVGLASPAAAQPNQQGLINVNISDLVVQIPVAIAANICDVNIAVLVADLVDDAATCNAEATPDADAEITTTDGGAPPTQDGLVNVNVSSINVQAPIGVVANVCDVNAAVLVNLVADDSAPCEGSADPDSTITLN